MSLLSIFDHAEMPSRDEPCTVSELTDQIKAVLETGFAEVAVRGEISGLSRPRSGHVYLKLKDASAQVSAVLWKSDAQRVAFDLHDGLAVRVWGRVVVYAPRGEYQVTIRKIEPEGIGALELAFRQMVDRLAAEGLFAAERKRPLPRFPRRVVVVTSPTGAAVRDLLQVVGRRWPAAEMLIVPTRVQGAGAGAEVAAAIALANRVAGADLLIVTRGGGSLEDLWAFNEEVVARAIFASRLPVAAVGHEVYVTIADLVADVRALTPSEAGERCVPDRAEIRKQLERLAERLRSAGQGAISDARLGLDALADRLDRGVRRAIDLRADRLARAAGRLEALSPLRALARGYSVTARADDPNRPLRDAADLRPGERLVTRLGRGTVVSQVESVEAGPAQAGI